MDNKNMQNLNNNNNKPLPQNLPTLEQYYRNLIEQQKERDKNNARIPGDPEKRNATTLKTKMNQTKKQVSDYYGIQGKELDEALKNYQNDNNKQLIDYIQNEIIEVENDNNLEEPFKIKLVLEKTEEKLIYDYKKMREQLKNSLTLSNLNIKLTPKQNNNI